MPSTTAFCTSPTCLEDRFPHLKHDDVLRDEYGDPVECLDDRGEGTCSGPVGYHAVPGGNAVPRCDGHFEDRLQRWEDSDLERYADSDVAPAWFDPTACGERWDDDY